MSDVPHCRHRMAKKDAKILEEKTLFSHCDTPAFIAHFLRSS